MKKNTAFGCLLFLIMSYGCFPAYGAPSSSPGSPVPAAVVPLAAPDASRIGVVAAFKGTVNVSRAGAVGKITASGEPVFLGDEVSTDEKGTLQILLLDETVFTIGPSSSIVIDKFIYDPSSEEGEVNARVVKGVFRFVTGKIARKKPSKMKVDLPSGTIGIRGTMVAGECAGKKSLVLLLGPGARHNTQHHEGSIVVSNQVGGNNKSVEVNRAGYGTLIEGIDAAPKAAFQVPEAEVSRINAALEAPPSPDQPGEEAGEGSEGSATEKSGQGRAQAGSEIRQDGKRGRFLSQFSKESEKAAQQQTATDINQILDGPTSRNQLQIAAQKMSGVFHFNQTGVTLSGLQSGMYTLNYDIDFGARQVGGGNSKVTGDLGSGNDFTFILGSRLFGVGTDNAGFNYPSVINTTGSSCQTSFCNKASIDIGINNRNGIIADTANHTVTIKSNSNVEQASGSGVAERVNNAS